MCERAAFRGKLVQAVDFWYPCDQALADIGADSTLCCCANWILQMTAVCFARKVTNIRHPFRAAQLPRQGCGSSLAWFCLKVSVVFIDQSRALQSFAAAAVRPHTQKCAGWLAVPVRTGAPAYRSAHSTVATLNTSSPGAYDSSCMCNQHQNPENFPQRFLCAPFSSAGKTAMRELAVWLYIMHDANSKVLMTEDILVYMAEQLLPNTYSHDYIW